MPSSFQKTRKQIAKKRGGGDIPALHEKSRDSLRLHKASVRDQRLDRLAAARSKREQPILDRADYFREALPHDDDGALEVAAVQGLISSFIHRYELELDGLKKSRRPGRPATAREDLLKMKIGALRNEYATGFVLPDVTKKDNSEALRRWEGSWTTLTTVPWIKVSTAGQVRPADFPTKGLS